MKGKKAGITYASHAIVMWIVLGDSKLEIGVEEVFSFALTFILILTLSCFGIFAANWHSGKG